MQTIEKLEKTVDAGNYYEAQQMYKSISARYEDLPFLYSPLRCIIKLFFFDWNYFLWLLVFDILFFLKR